MIWVVGKEKTGQINKGRSVFTQLSFFALSSFQLFWDSIYNHYTHRVSFWLYNKLKACTSERSNLRKNTFEVTFSVNCSYLKLLLTAVTIWSRTVFLSLF